jgi:predicted nucleic acid-binding protein
MSVRASRPRVFLDADVLFAGAASPTTQGASNTILRLAELTLLECITSEQAYTEAERNLAAKVPLKLPTFHHLIYRCVKIVPDPALDDLTRYTGQADAKDLPILVAALREQCSHLITFNTRHYYPLGKIIVQRPGELVMTVRGLLSLLTSNGDAK